MQFVVVPGVASKFPVFLFDDCFECLINNLIFYSGPFTERISSIDFNIPANEETVSLFQLLNVTKKNIIY